MSFTLLKFNRFQLNEDETPISHYVTVLPKKLLNPFILKKHQKHTPIISHRKDTINSTQRLHFQISRIPFSCRKYLEEFMIWIMHAWAGCSWTLCVSCWSKFTRTRRRKLVRIYNLARDLRVCSHFAFQLREKSRSERVRGQEQKTTWWVVGGVITGSSLISIQNRLTGRSRLNLQERNYSWREGIGWGGARGSMREQGRAVREHTDETGVSAQAEQRRLSQQLVTCWPQFGETIYNYTSFLKRRQRELDLSSQKGRVKRTMQGYESDIHGLAEVWSHFHWCLSK